MAEPAAEEAPPGQRPDWVGVRAVAWVLDEAPVPADLALTLLAIARRCDQNGKGSYQSVGTLAAKTGKSPDQIRRDIVKLRKEKLLVEGDQSLVGHLPAGQRPVVYDLPLSVKGPKPVKESKNKSGLKKPEVTPCMEATPGMDAGGGMEATPTPGMDAGPTPCMEATQRSPLKNPVEEPSSPQPPSTGSPPLVDSPEEGEETEEDRKNRLADRIQQIRPAWGRRSIHQAITVALEDRRPWPAIERALLAVAEDPDTQAPGRLNADGPWWNEPEPASRLTLSRSDHAKLTRFRAECPHGEAGGNIGHPDDGWVTCATCRHEAGWTGAASTSPDPAAFLDQRYARAGRKRATHQPFLNADYTDADYSQPL